jgi:hypothetical protein
VSTDKATATDDSDIHIGFLFTDCLDR